MKIRLFLRISVLVFSLYACGNFIFYGKEGIMATDELRRKNREIKTSIVKLEKSLALLQKRIDAYDSDPVFVRERLLVDELMSCDDTIYVLPRSLV